MDEIKPWIGRYALILFLTWGAFLLAGVLLARFASISLPGGAVAIIPPMAAALITGQAWGRSEGAVPGNAAMWKLAAVGAGLYFGMQVLLAGGSFASLTRVSDGVVTPTVMAITIGMLAVLGAVSAFVGRLFLAMGAKSALKR